MCINECGALLMYFVAKDRACFIFICASKIIGHKAKMIYMSKRENLTDTYICKAKIFKAAQRFQNFRPA